MRSTYKHIIKHVVHNSFALIFLVLFSVVMAQPHKFEVDYQEKGTDFVLAYEELLNDAKTNDASIAFESLIVGEDGSTKITYVVQAGDTLSDIAKNFGTTTSTIMDANGLESANTIRPGQRLTIAYNEGIMHEIESETTLAEFAATYNLNVNDLLTLNYIEDPSQTLEVGTQLFVDLNKVEATQRGLLEKPTYEMIATNTAPSEEEIDTQDAAEPEGEPDEQQPEQEVAYQQEVISAEETERRLQEQQAAQQEESAPESEPEPEEGLCPDSQCEYRGKCFTKPANAHCTNDDSIDDAWTCNEGYEEDGRSCVAIPEPEPQSQPEPTAEEEAPQEQPTPEPTPEPEQAPEEEQQPEQALAANTATPEEIVEEAPTVEIPTEKPVAIKKDRKEEVLEKWYFNPRKAGFPGNGRGPGHCTEYAAYYRWENYGINLRDYIRGNAGQRYDAASRAGLSVGDAPQKGAIVVMKYGSSGRAGYGHVGIITDIDWENRYIRIQDMNFLGRYVVTDHWVDMDSQRNPVIGYIYPH